MELQLSGLASGVRLENGGSVLNQIGAVTTEAVAGTAGWSIRKEIYLFQSLNRAQRS